jgi:hypothetical protein
MQCLSRRSFCSGMTVASLGLLSGCGLAPRSAAQARVAKLGLLGSARSRVWEAFLDQLADLGYLEGRNLALETRWSEGRNERFPDLAAELVAARVDASGLVKE